MIPFISGKIKINSCESFKLPIYYDNIKNYIFYFYIHLSKKYKNNNALIIWRYIKFHILNDSTIILHLCYQLLIYRFQNGDNDDDVDDDDDDMSKAQD